MALDPRLHTPIALGAFGVVFLAVGLFVLWSDLRAPPDPAQAAPVVDAAALAGQAPGALVLLEGTIAKATQPLESRLVLLQRQVATGKTRPGTNEVRFSWVVEATEGRPFSLEGRAGTVTVRVVAAELRDPPHQVPADVGVVTAGTRRLSGFEAGDAVGVLATVRSATEVEASVVAPGSAASLKTSLATSALVPKILGGIFVLVGLATALSAAVMALRP